MFENIFDNHEVNCASVLLDECKQSLFLTGKAGTGKSTFIQYATTFSETHCIIGAPTGIAALNVGGKTLNSTFHLPAHFVMPNDSVIDKIHFYEEDEMIIYNSDLIIIDEVSMVSSPTLDSIDFLLKRICKSTLPFGGKRMLFVGDPFQLPPIVKDEDRSELLSEYKSEYFFHSKAYQKLNPITVELLKNYRQEDGLFLNILNNIREKQNIAESIAVLNENCYNNGIETMEQKANAITLTFTNKAANELNIQNLNSINSEEFLFTATIEGEFDRNDIIAEKYLRLKVGARVMMIYNHLANLYVNGTLGYIEEINENNILVKVDDGSIVQVDTVTWENKKPVKELIDGKWHKEYKTVGSFEQYPMKLAWAITVHKSQGLTFDNVYLLNKGNAFASAHVYVALSRCRSMEGLSLYRPIKVSEAIVATEIIKFYETIKDTSRMDDLIQEYIEWKDEESDSLDDTN